MPTVVDLDPFLFAEATKLCRELNSKKDKETLLRTLSLSLFLSLSRIIDHSDYVHAPMLMYVSKSQQ